VRKKGRSWGEEFKEQIRNPTESFSNQFWILETVSTTGMRGTILDCMTTWCKRAHSKDRIISSERINSHSGTNFQLLWKLYAGLVYLSWYT